ncbi:uncharacterized protein LOC130047098 isoform X4 [Ostrea edulis]|nr:uncharacterized protein LOC130047096 isoform X4 [Ostrea edulis]XP_055997330.1 uncharacterized protein LOC130047098 isoform X4 [Ostrea edulis]XP_055997331.1 uncharacterized protein LOC130047098 isoform X4 [Ostrea edulis]
MKQNEKYWIKDNVVERSVVTKGCQTKVNVLNSTTIEDNILSKCFQFCSESSDTVGIQENNCSCLSNLNNGFDNVCDDQCVWTNEQCKEIAAFSVYERKDYKSILSGYRFDRCITLFYTQQLFWTKTDCSKKCHYICQKNGDLLVNSQEEVTWLEAVSICARNQSVLANILPETNVKLPRNARYRLSYWVGIRQHYETVSDDKSVCHYIERYKANDILYGAETCTKELHYICLNEDTTSTSMVKPSDSTTQHPVSVTNHQGFGAHKLFKEVVESKFLLKDMRKLSPLRQTYSLGGVSQCCEQLCTEDRQLFLPIDNAQIEYDSSTL